MATLPRVHSSKHGISDGKISSPFSTSPRKLQEMSLPVPEGGHDNTNISGISMKQYEDQLNGLRKENFHLKLRIYFLEEKLGTGSPPAVQGLLEHNVRLQVEVEELRRQLSDKQELLAAAAEAIDVLEQQGSISTDSVETSMHNDIVKREQNNDVKDDITDDTCAESETVTDFLGVTVNQGDSEEMVKLRRENRKALQMIKGCMKKIQQQDKEIKKLKLNKELAYAHVSDSQMEKYEEILKCKDEHIKELETKIKELQTATDNLQNDDNSGNLQQLLTRRLQGLTFFLDKLLAHKCVLGEDKQRLAESILEQSLALPVGLQLDESVAAELSVDESLDASRLRLNDLTLMFGHHVGCERRATADLPSESDCWSEPDRRVSQARVGLNSAVVTETLAKTRPRRDRASRSDDDAALLDEITRLSRRVDSLQEDNDKLRAEIQRDMTKYDDLVEENRRLAAALADERDNLCEANRNMEATRTALLAAEAQVRVLERELSEATAVTTRLTNERLQLEEAHIETERVLRRAADEAALTASQAALERARAQHERIAAERELDAARDELATTRDEMASIRDELATLRLASPLVAPAPPAPPAPSDDERPTSPDQGIDSDRLSSLEHSDGVRMSPRSLYEENITLKQKLARTKTTLAETLAQLNAANLRKRSVQRAICREIHKTQGVLRKARDQFENQS